MSNKAEGTAFEKELAKVLSDRGFWVHRFQDNKNGQPADIIAVLNENAFLIDCKDCQTDTFQLSRIEPNQHSAMQLWHDCGNGSGMFAIRMQSKKVYMIPYSFMRWLGNEGFKNIPENLMINRYFDLTRWLDTFRACEDDLWS